MHTSEVKACKAKIKLMQIRLLRDWNWFRVVLMVAKFSGLKATLVPGSKLMLKVDVFMMSA